MVHYVMKFVSRNGDKEIYTEFWCGSLPQYCVQWHSLMLPVLNLWFLLTESQLATSISNITATLWEGMVPIGTVKDYKNFHIHSISSSKDSSIHHFNRNVKTF